MSKKRKVSPESVMLKLLQTCRPHASQGEVLAKATVLEFLNTQEDIHVLDIMGVGLEVQVGESSESNVMFTAHLDTVHKIYGSQVVVSDEAGNLFAETDDGKPTVLGADDAAGVYLLLTMIKAKVKGLYLFFEGEEYGGIGSGEYSVGSVPTRIKQVVSFDRRGYHDVVTHQMGGRCCSDEYANALADELNVKMGEMFYDISDGGVFTDSASFIDIVAECTNISVGYFNEHTTNESLDFGFLKDLGKAIVKVNWNALPILRDPTVKDDLSNYWERYFNGLDDYIKIPYEDALAIYKRSENVLTMYYDADMLDELPPQVRDLLLLIESVLGDKV